MCICLASCYKGNIGSHTGNSLNMHGWVLQRKIRKISHGTCINVWLVVSKAVTGKLYSCLTCLAWWSFQKQHQESLWKSVSRKTFYKRLVTVFLHFLQLYCHNAISPMGKSGCLPRGKPAATQPSVHAGCFSVSIILRTLIWTKGSLTCALM